MPMTLRSLSQVPSALKKSAWLSLSQENPTGKSSFGIGSVRSWSLRQALAFKERLREAFATFKSRTIHLTRVHQLSWLLGQETHSSTWSSERKRMTLSSLRITPRSTIWSRDAISQQTSPATRGRRQPAWFWFARTTEKCSCAPTMESTSLTSWSHLSASALTQSTLTRTDSWSALRTSSWSSPRTMAMRELSSSKMVTASLSSCETQRVINLETITARFGACTPTKKKTWSTVPLRLASSLKPPSS